MTRTSRTVLFLLTILLLSPLAARGQHFPANADLELMLRYLVEDKATPAIVIGILEADGSTRVLSQGNAGAGARPLGPKSVFEIGSINKTFTGTLLADMVNKGEVALADPISKYLPAGVTAPSRNGRAITLLDLATHRSGLPRLPDNHTPADRANPYADYTIEKLYAFLSKHQLTRDPGAEGEYSNLGVGLLGHLLARAAKTSYVDLVQKRILDPLGMRMTSYALDGEVAAWMTKGHVKGEMVPFWFATEAIHGAGGLRSNVEDMLKYLKANVGPAKTDLERAMREAQKVRAPVKGDLSIGLGWQVQQYQGRALIQHGGGTGGFTAFIGFDPDKRVGVVMLTNTGQFPDDPAQDFLRRGPPLAIPEVKVAKEVLETYVGDYEVAPGRIMSVKLEPEGWLTIRVPNNVRFRMYAQSHTAFFVKRAPWRFTFNKDAAGIELIGDLDGTERRSRKVKSGG
jgi:D-alanyl-D-alanine-carboxypeptidase/D-alanyl-D-alanine-endopeptidase